MNFPITDGGVTEHPLTQHVQMRTCQHITLHSLITFHHANMRGSSLRICVPKTFCHPRVMSRSLPHLTLTTSTSSLSPTSPILQSSSLTHPRLLSHDPYTLRRFTAELRFLGSPVSHNVCGDRFCFRERSDPLVIVEKFCGGVLLFVQEHELRIE